MVGNADFADVVQRRRFEEQLDRVLGRECDETRMVTQLFGQRSNVELGAANVVARFVVAGNPL